MSALRLTPDVARIIADPVQAAQVVAHFLHFDPAFWLHEAGLAGLTVPLDGESICLLSPQGMTTQLESLDAWLKLADGRKDVEQLLGRRRGPPQPRPSGPNSP